MPVWLRFGIVSEGRPNYGTWRCAGVRFAQRERMKRKSASNSPTAPTNGAFLVFGAPAIEEAEIEEVVACLRSGWLGTGPKVAQFEEDFRRYKGSRYAVAVNSCTAALHLSMLAAGLQPGDEVITTPLTFCATVNAIVHAGLKPVLADVDPVTMNIDPEQVTRRITERTKAIVPVHFAGRPCAMDALMEIARRHDLRVIEDCAHAIETEFEGRGAGTFGNFGCFSFYATKNVVTGEGGMVITDDEQGAAKIKRLALHGMTQDAWRRFGDEGYKHYHVVECGFKYNMMDIQAALGIHQLRRVEACAKRREAIWDRYNAAFSTLPLTLPAPIAPQTRHARHLYTILLDERRCGIRRDAFLDAMTVRNIGLGVHYLSLPEHLFYRQEFGWRLEDYPHATRIGRQTVSLPLSARLTDHDVERVIQAVVGVLGK
jgi:dTDP-4-amino-4,6-dideoxygalactose transaminase